jgi:hypothetical protein
MRWHINRSAAIWYNAIATRSHQATGGLQSNPKPWRLVGVNRPISTAFAAPLQFLVGEFTDFRAPPCLGGESLQYARPAAIGIFVSVRIQAGKWIRVSISLLRSTFTVNFRSGNFTKAMSLLR